MRFNHYINESSFKEDMTIEEINYMIQKDCKYYLSLTQGKYMFKRGMAYHRDIFGKKQVRQDRVPRGMNPDVFKKLNKWLEKYNHSRRDKSVIAANIKNKTNMFGDVYGIFPIGKFDYTGLMARDMNMSSGSGDSIATKEFFEYGYAKSISRDFRDYFTTNSSLKKAGEEYYEIGFTCKEYYYFSFREFDWHDNLKILVKNIF